MLMEYNSSRSRDMRRAIVLFFVAGLCITIAGCNSMQKKKEQNKEPERAALEEVTPTQATADEQAAKQPSQALANKSEKVEKEKIEKITPDEPLTPTPASGVRKHIVQRGDTLFKLARFYYGDQKYWKKIWLANKEIIPDPNKLKVGQELIIP